jgi:hypothetical protein
VPTLKDVPPGSRRQCGRALSFYMVRLAADPHDKAANVVHYLFARWVLRRDAWHATGGRGRGGARRAAPRAPDGRYSSLPRRLAAFLAGDWEGLHAAYVDAARAPAVARRENALLRRQEQASAKVGENALGKGMGCLLENATVVADADDAVHALQPLHPAAGAITDAQRAQVQGWLRGVVPWQASLGDMQWALRSAAKGSAPGPSCLRTRHLQRLLLENMALSSLFTGSLDEDLRKMWGSCTTIALTKGAGGHRPISMGNVDRRITGRAALHAHKKEIETRFRGVGGCTNLQLGCMTSNGSEAVIHELALHMELHPDHTLLHADATV